FDPFYPTKGHGGQAAEALVVCARCPVRRECLTDAIRVESLFRADHQTGIGARKTKNRRSYQPTQAPEGVYGVWGGTLPQERQGATLADIEELMALSDARAACLTSM